MINSHNAQAQCEGLAVPCLTVWPVPPYDKPPERNEALALVLSTARELWIPFFP